MKLLLTHPDPEHMANARQYLLRHGIPVSVSERSGQLELWLLQDNYQETALNLLRDFDDLPADHQVAQPSHQQSMFGPTLRSLSQQAGLLTFAIFLMTLAVAAAQLVFSPQAVMGSLMITPLHSMQLSLSEPWRLVTPAFIHLSATHLVFNLFWWWYLGGRIELRLGAGHLALIFLVTAISSNLLQWYTSGPLFGGMSGVVYGLLGFCTLYSWRRPTSLSLPPALIVFMVAWLLLGYTDLLWVNVANEAHLMGLISGSLLGALYRLREKSS
ncbi:rhomboid family intramembrane serine protease [Aliidiomarina minuta]|uniref:Rhomboid family intramembrane serine protease n=1 Tax=Aliidiomarina minuta TaxID=880057 RepID=A0A432W9H5_9GAMM|nr:rhomboid family intramembrane serine protease [Aliidiomarina minuta]RUO26774.1 rhomboid family intramembrane serine protease [Aliidiomarina minuta]